MPWRLCPPDDTIILGEWMSNTTLASPRATTRRQQPTYQHDTSISICKCWCVVMWWWKDGGSGVFPRLVVDSVLTSASFFCFHPKPFFKERRFSLCHHATTRDNPPLIGIVCECCDSPSSEFARFGCYRSWCTMWSQCHTQQLPTLNQNRRWDFVVRVGATCVDDRWTQQLSIFLQE